MPWGTSGWYTVATAKPLTTALPPIINATAKRITNKNTNFSDNSDKSHVNYNINKQSNRNNRVKVTKATDESTSSNDYFNHGHNPKLIDSVFSGSFYKNPYDCNCDGKSKSNRFTTTTTPQSLVDQEEESADGTTNQHETRDNSDDNRPSETHSVNDFDDEQINSEQSLQDVKKSKRKSNNKKSPLQRATAKILESTNPSSLEFLCEQFIQVNDLTFNHTLGRFIASSSSKLRKNGKIKRKKVTKSSQGKISQRGKTRITKQSNQMDKTLQLVEREGSIDMADYTSSIGQFSTTTTKLPVAARKSRNQSPVLQTNRFSSPATSWADKYDRQTDARDDEDDDDIDKDQDDDTDDTTEATTRAGRTSTTAADKIVQDQWNQQEKEKGQVKGGRSRPRITSGAVKGRNGQVKKPLRERD